MAWPSGETGLAEFDTSFELFFEMASLPHHKLTISTYSVPRVPRHNNARAVRGNQVPNFSLHITDVGVVSVLRSAAEIPMTLMAT
jgi:hypothetical protein